MQKWEYAEVEVTIGGPISGTSVQGWIYSDDGKHKEINGKLGVIFASLGLNGWELVSSNARIEAGLTNKHKINYIFKRAILE
jgi:hypothetical protein